MNADDIKFDGEDEGGEASASVANGKDGALAPVKKVELK